MSSSWATRTSAPGRWPASRSRTPSSWRSSSWGTSRRSGAGRPGGRSSEMAPLNTVEGRIIWLGALATLALYTVLYRENRVYRTAEHLFVGLAAGYGAYLVWSQVLYPKWWVPMVQEGRWPWALA